MKNINDPVLRETLFSNTVTKYDEFNLSSRTLSQLVICTLRNHNNKKNWHTHCQTTASLKSFYLHKGANIKFGKDLVCNFVFMHLLFWGLSAQLRR